jgi:hypothetical protein
VRGLGHVLLQKLARMLHPIVLAVLVLAMLALAGRRWQQARVEEATHLLGWYGADALEATRVEAGPVKTDMLIRPALLLRPRPGKPSEVQLELAVMPEQLHGWYGLDDDQAQQRGQWANHHLRIEARPQNAAGTWATLLDVRVAHAPRQVPIVLDTGPLAGQTVELRIVDTVRDERVARFGMNLQLGAGP